MLTALAAVILHLSMFFPAGAQQTQSSAVMRDPQAVAILRQSVTAMGGRLPADSAATGSITTVAGTAEDSGTIRILTRGTDQSAEYVQTAKEQRSMISSKDRAVDSRLSKPMSMELALTSQPVDFPLPLLFSVLNDPDCTILDLGPETIEGRQLRHLRFWRTFSNQPRLQRLAEVSRKDLWVDAASFLPHQLAYERRATSGPGSAHLAVSIFYADYRNIQGLLYPFTILVSLNGTSWATIQLQNVTFDSGLNDSEFASGRSR